MQPRHVALTFLLTAAGFVNAQTLADLPGCGQTCFTNMVQQGKQLGCPDGAISCLCTKADFNNGIHDCAQKACAPDLFTTVTKYVSSLCAATIAPPATTSATSQITPSSASTTTASPVSSISSTSSTALLTAQTTSSTTSPSTSPASSAVPSSTITTSSADASSASSTATSTAAVVGPGSSSSDATASPVASPASGLSSNAKIGVGVGAAAGGVALITLGACILVTRRQKVNQGRFQSLQISDPLPGSGRTYANDHRRQQYGAGMSELEMRSKRYEDMVPRQSPRTMV